MEIMNISEAILDIMKHIQVLNDDYTQLSVDVAVLKSQMSTLMWWFRAFAATFVALLASQIWQVMHMKKDGKNK